MQSTCSILRWLTATLLVTLGLAPAAWAQTPVQSSAIPNAAITGGEGSKQVINGTDITSASPDAPGATPPTAADASATEVTAELPASLITTIGYSIMPVSAVGGISNPFTRPINLPPAITRLTSVTTLASAPPSTVAASTNSLQTAPTTNSTTAVLPTVDVAVAPATAIPSPTLAPINGVAHVSIGGYDTSSSNGSLVVSPPSISALSPASAVAGGAAFTLTVNGTYFTTTSSIIWNATPLTTTYLSATQLTATVPASLIATANTASVTATATGGISSAVSFIVKPNNLPVIYSLSPSQLPAGFGSFTMQIFGTNLMATQTVKWGTTTLPVIGSWNILWVTVPANLVTTQGTASITITTSNGTSAPATFTIKPPNPIITSLSPSSISAGGAPFTLTVTGANFVPNSYIIFSGVWLYAYKNSTQLSALVPANLFAKAGNVTVEVYAPGSMSNYSAPAIFTINPSPPAITSLSPASVIAGYGGFMLTINGSAFTPDTTFMWGATPLYTVYVSPTQMRADVLPNLLANVGTSSVTVTNSTGTSAPVTFTINQAPPNIGGLSPAVRTAGSAPFAMIITGQYFTPASTVKWGSTSLTATYISQTQLTAQVPATLITSASTPLVTVTNSAGTSGSATITVNPPLNIVTTTLPSGTVGNAYSGPIGVTGGSPGYNWTVSGLPSTLTFTNTFDRTLTITGTPYSSGAITFQVAVTDSAGAIAGPISYTINVAAAASGVNNASLNGSYTCLMQGIYDEDGTRWATVASFQADGLGSFTNGIFDTNSHDIGSGSGILTGSYNIGSDFNGQASLRTVLTDGAAGIQTIHWALALSTSAQPAQQFRMVEIDDLGTLPSGQQGTANCYLAVPSAFSANTVSGSSFVFGLDGEDNSGNLKATVGRFSASGGQITGGHIDSALGGSATVHSTAFTATNTAPDPATGRFKITLHGGVNPTGLTVYIIDAKRMFVLDNGNNSGEQAGNMLTQLQASNSAATVDGPFVLYLRGAEFNSSGNAPSSFYSNLVQGTADGVGNMTINQSYTDDNGVYSTSKSITGLTALTFDVSNPGRATFTSASGTTYLYLFNNNSAVEMSVGDNGSLDSGWLEPQLQSTFTSAALAGNYLFGEMPLLSGALNAGAGEYHLTSGGAITGSATMTGQEYLSWDQYISMTYSWDATAPNTGAFFVANGAQGTSSCIVISQTKFVCSPQTDIAPSVQVIGQ